MTQIAYIFFGWLLGIGSGLLLWWHDRKYKRHDFKKGLAAELQGVLQRLVGTSALLKVMLGEFDRDMLTFVRSKYSREDNPFMDHEMEDVVAKLLSVTDEQLDHLSLVMREKYSAGTAKSLKKIDLHFLEANMKDMSMLDVDSQILISDIRRVVSHMSAEIDHYYFYLRKTFEPGLSEEVQNILQQNIRATYRGASVLSIEAANRISELLDRLETGVHRKTATTVRTFLKIVESKIRPNR